MMSVVFHLVMKDILLNFHSWIQAFQLCGEEVPSPFIFVALGGLWRRHKRFEGCLKLDEL